jgi:hypothetical protein
MWKLRWAPNNASRWQMGFNLAFKGLIYIVHLVGYFHSCVTMYGFMIVKYTIRSFRWRFNGIRPYLKGNVCSRYQDPLNYRTDLFNKDIFRKLMILRRRKSPLISATHSQNVFKKKADIKKSQCCLKRRPWEVYTCHTFLLTSAWGSTVSLIYDMIYLAATGWPPGGSCSVYIYTQTIPVTSRNKQCIEQHKNT